MLIVALDTPTPHLVVIFFLEGAQQTGISTAINFISEQSKLLVHAAYMPHMAGQLSFDSKAAQDCL